MAPTYKLKLLTDLMDVPDDRLDACLDEMKILIRSMRTVRAAAAGPSATPAMLRDYNRTLFPNIVWTDDGSVDVSIKHRGQSVLRVAVKTKDVTLTMGALPWSDTPINSRRSYPLTQPLLASNCISGDRTSVLEEGDALIPAGATIVMFHAPGAGEVHYKDRVWEF